MEDTELLEILAKGEDSYHQLKENFTNVDSVAAELVAFSNAGGGLLVIGVNDKTRLITGLNADDVSRLNNLLSNAASQHVKPPINPLSSNVSTASGIVMVIDVPEGLNKPYTDLQGRVWVKVVGDKRHVTAREEIQRMFQQAGLVYADEIPITALSVSDFDEKTFGDYFKSRYKQTLDQTNIPLPQLLDNMNLAKNGYPNLTGLLLFGKKPQLYRPAFIIKAVAFPGRDLHTNQYNDSEDIDGRLADQYQKSLSFIKRNLHHLQGDRGVNTLGKLEIPEESLEEVLVNALIHRDYFISAPIKIFVFIDRIEIISPGHLPNHLTSEHIRYGLSNMRNPMLASYATHILPYRGLGSGIPRALHAWPRIDLIDDRDGNQFKVVIHRP